MEQPHQPFVGGYSDGVTEVDGMLWDAASRLARSQIARQMAVNSSLRRQHQSRIHKPVSTGNSPQNVSRRRMAAPQRPGPHHAAYTDGYSTMSRRRAITAVTRNPLSELRPTTWHPTAMNSPNDYSQYRHTLYEVPHHSMPYRSTPQSEHNDSHRGRYYSVPGSGVFSSGYMHVPISSDWSTEPSHTPPSAVSSASMMHATIYGNQAQGQMGIPVQQFVPWTPSTFVQPAQAQPTPAAVKVQLMDSTESPSNSRASQLLQDNDDGPELVAMGLYDPPEKPSLLFGGAGEPSPSREGRGLKLEDAWTPPEDDESSDDGEGEDEDEEEDGEAEENEEDQDSDHQDDEMDAEPSDNAVPDVYGACNLLPFDMSNKSFFFDDATVGMQGATAIQGLAMQGWNAPAQAWAS